MAVESQCKAQNKSEYHKIDKKWNYLSSSSNFDAMGGTCGCFSFLEVVSHASGRESIFLGAWVWDDLH